MEFFRKINEKTFRDRGSGFVDLRLSDSNMYLGAITVCLLQSYF